MSDLNKTEVIDLICICGWIDLSSICRSASQTAAPCVEYNLISSGGQADEVLYGSYLMLITGQAITMQDMLYDYLSLTVQAFLSKQPGLCSCHNTLATNSV